MKETINSAIVALLLCCNSVSMIIQSDGIVVGTVFLCFTFLLLFNIRKYIIDGYHKRSLFTIFLVLVLLISSSVLGTGAQYQLYFLNFICYGIPFLLLPIMQVDYRKVLIYISWYGLLFLPFYVTYDYASALLNYQEDGGLLMTVSYRILPFIISSLYSFFSSFSFKIKLLFLIESISYLIILFIFGSRGAQLGIMFFLIVFVAYFFKSKQAFHRYLIISSIVILFFFFFFVDVINVLVELFDNNDVQALALNRIQYKLTEGDDMDSGRIELIQMAMDDFYHNPIFGKGIGSFMDYTHYPHNVFFHILCENGLIIFLIVSALIFKGVIDIFNYDLNNQYRGFLLFVFCSGIIQLLFSFYFWGSQYFWTFIFLIINKKYLLNNPVIGMTYNKEQV